jgi:hypothetical protein
MLVGGLFEFTPGLDSFLKGQYSSVSAWSIVIGIIIIVGIVAVWMDYALAGGILSIIIGAWVIILEGGGGLVPAVSTLFFLGGVVSIMAGGLKIIRQSKSTKAS